jgi:hypothetical protein
MRLNIELNLLFPEMFCVLFIPEPKYNPAIKVAAIRSGIQIMSLLRFINEAFID